MAVLSFGNSLNTFAYKESEDTADIEKKEKIEKQTVRVERVKETITLIEPLTPTKSASSTPTKRTPTHSNNNQSHSPSPKRAKRNQINLEDIQDKRLTPLLQPDLKCVFVGFNPGTESALQGHYYAHRSNLFWKLLYESGCVSRPVTFKDDVLMPDEFSIGFTDLIARPTPGIKQLSGKEMVQGVPILEEKIAKYKPRIVCLVGKGIWESIYRYKRGKRFTDDFEWGLQLENLGGCSVYVVPSTSGLAASISRETKLRVWKALSALLNPSVARNNGAGRCPAPGGKKDPSK